MGVSRLGGVGGWQAPRVRPQESEQRTALEPVVDVLGDTGLQSRVLEETSSARNYREWLCDLALPYLGDDPLELGSGLGDYAQTWLDRGVPRMTLSEVDPSRLDVLRARFREDRRVEVITFDASNAPTRSHSSYVAFNVFEHIADDVAALRSAHRLVRPGGRVIVFVPAFPIAMSKFDREIGHQRRYTRRGLGDAFREAGLQVESVRFVNAPGLLAWFVGMRILGMRPGEGIILRVWDRLVVPAARVVESRARPPFGQSLLAVARVPSTP